MRVGTVNARSFITLWSVGDVFSPALAIALLLDGGGRGLGRCRVRVRLGLRGAAHQPLKKQWYVHRRRKNEERRVTEAITALARTIIELELPSSSSQPRGRGNGKSKND